MNMKKFNERMARPKYSKGGYIKKIAGRKYFDAGGIASGSATTGSGTGGVNTAQGLAQNAANLLGTNAVGANITPGTNASQLNAAYTNAQSGLNQQQGLVNTLTPQAQTGVNTQNQVEAQELAMSQGAGPNPAQAELNQATVQNVNQEAALLAGQRGASANVGMAGRNIAQQGASTQQQAAGQAATLEAQQQIAAQNNAAQIAANQIGQTAGVTTGLNTAAQNEQNTLENANSANNTANVGMQSNLNTTNASTNSGILGGIGNALSNVPVIGSLFEKGGEVGKDGQVSPHGKHKLEFVHKMAKLGLENFESGGTISPPPPPDPKQVFSDSLKGATGSHTFGFAAGGPVPQNPLLSSHAATQQPIATGQYNPIQSVAGPTIDNSTPNMTELGTNAADKTPKSVAMGTTSDPTDPNITGSNNPLVTNGQADVLAPGYADTDTALNLAYKGGEMHSHFDKHFDNYFSEGGSTGKVPAMVSPGEVYLNPEAVERVKHGADPLKEGVRVPGKAKVKGDSLKNDTVPATLDAGGVVIDRKHVGHPDKARLFVLKSLKATGKHMKRPKGA